MKQILLVSLLSLNVVNAQKAIAEKTIEKNKLPIDHFYDEESKSFFIGYGQPNEGMVGGNQINEICLYSVDGTENKFLEDRKLYGLAFSSDGKAFMTSDISKGVLSAKTKLFTFDKKEIEIQKKNFKGISLVNFFYKKVAFTSSTVFNLTNSKGSLEIDLKKDKKLKVLTADMVTLKKESFDLETLNTDRLLNESTIKPKERVGVVFNVNDDNSFSLITKAISKDYTKSTLYKTNYSRDGKITEDLSFEINLKNLALLYSRNNGGETIFGGYDGKFTHFGDDNFINNFYIDKATGDVYIYGLFGNEISQLNTQGNPKGFYVFKFDSKGNKIWESVNKINEQDFNRDHAMPTVYTNLSDIKGKICFTIRINGLKDYFMYSFLDKQAGTVSLKELNFDQTFAHLESVPGDDYEINSDFKEDKSFKNKMFDFNTIIAINSDKKVFDYIKNRESKLKTNFYVNFSKNQTWLYEENKESFKVVLFED